MLTKFPFSALLVVFFFMSTTCSAQQDFFLETLQVRFSLPDHFKLINNTAKKFEATHQQTTVTIMPLPYKELDWKAIDKATLQVAGKLDMEDITEGKHLDLYEFKSYCVSGQLNEQQVVIVGLMHEQKQQPFTLLISSPEKSDKLIGAIIENITTY